MTADNDTLRTCEHKIAGDVRRGSDGAWVPCSCGALMPFPFDSDDRNGEPVTALVIHLQALLRAALASPAAEPGLDELRALSDAATPGPWTFGMTGSEGGTLAPVEGRGRIARFTHRTFGEDKANGSFAAAAVNYLRERLSRVPATSASGEAEGSSEEPR